jgi:hypothetical protein
MGSCAQLLALKSSKSPERVVAIRARLQSTPRIGGRLAIERIDGLVDPGVARNLGG